MRLSWARQAAITGLVAVAIADVLPPDDIPLMCVTICGPIVELTAKCDVHNHRLAKRQPNPDWPRNRSRMMDCTREAFLSLGLHRRHFLHSSSLKRARHRQLQLQRQGQHQRRLPSLRRHQ
ncbi:hypothetical protein LB503_007464 [Fusarium chuoi]|nr:hypothetical protein LB503_007464 [Fusarium chuoi]